MKPILLIIFDGLGDRPIKELDYQTPLEAAVKPNLDALAKMGITGLIHTIKRGVRPGSDVAHLALFGYEPKNHYSGRGPFEASGYGVSLQEGDVAFRGNLGTVNENFIITDRRAGRIDSSAPFAELLDEMVIDGVKVIAKPGLNHRIAIVLRGPGLSDQITDVDPHLNNKSPLLAKPKDGSKEAKKTSDIINKLVKKAAKLFQDHPINKQRQKENLPQANYLLLRGAGKLMSFEPFVEKYRLKAACISGAGLYKGIARIVGMDIVDVAGTTGKANTNVKGKIDAALELLKTYQFVFLHIKATDSLAEDGNAVGKKEFIEKADKSFSSILPLVKKKELITVVTGDHTTASDLRIHTADEVPILVSGYGVRTDAVQTFGERPCQLGGLGHMLGENLMDYLINLRGESELYGN